MVIDIMGRKLEYLTVSMKPTSWRAMHRSGSYLEVYNIPQAGKYYDRIYSCVQDCPACYPAFSQIHHHHHTPPNSAALARPPTPALAMPTAPHFPDEIWVEIVSSLPTQDVARVSLASRRLHCISQPLLYQEPELFLTQHHPPPLQALIRTLLTPGCETLARHVRCLTISWMHVQLPQDDDDQVSFTGAASRFGLGGWPLSADIQIMLLLHLLPHLQTLNFFPTDNTSWFRNLNDLHAGAHPRTALPIGLQSLSDFHCDFGNCVRPRALVVLLRLPHIRSIEMPICGDIELQLRGSERVSLGTSSVTSLTFPSARMPHVALKRILQIPRALTHFSYRAMRSTGEGLRLREFAEALAPLKNLLQTIVLDFSLLRNRSGDDVGDEGPATTLQDWPALRHVSTSLVPLLGMVVLPDSPGRLGNMLPPGIRTLLILRDNFWSGDEAVLELVLLLEQKETLVPMLESVAVCEQVEMTREMEDRLKSACVTAGVRMTRKPVSVTVNRAATSIACGGVVWGTG